jgi:hypothetical protein
MTEFESKNFWDGMEQRRIESVMQFVSLVSPSDAKAFVVGIDSISELIKQNNPEVLVVSQRGGVSIDWSLAITQESKGYNIQRRLYLPIGSQNDLRRARLGFAPTPEIKTSIVEKVVGYDFNSNGKLGKVAMVDEVKGGGSLNYFIQSALPILRNYGCESLYVVAACDPKAQIAKDPSQLVEKAKNSDVGISFVKVPLVFTDKRSFVEELAYDPNSPKRGFLVPHTIHNKEAQDIVEMITFAYFHPKSLDRLLSGSVPVTPTDLRFNEYFKKITSVLTESKPLTNWLNQYSSELSTRS